MIEYGIGMGTINPFDSRQMVETATEEGDPVKTAELFAKALNSNAIARNQLQAQAKQLQAEMNTWQRVAQAALKQNREDLARAALERKVKYKRQWTQNQEQLQQIDLMQQTLVQNSQKLQQQIAIDPAYMTTLT